jgi:hypothetical protein
MTLDEQAQTEGKTKARVWLENTAEGVIFAGMDSLAARTLILEEKAGGNFDAT